jgi:hypothetical protein
MAIMAGSSSTPRELIEAGMHIARCYKMIQIGTVSENVLGKITIMQKVRIGWEFPEMTKVFDEAKGAQPLVYEQEYTLSMGEKANLRKMLTSWRGKAFTEEEAKAFDITKLLGVPCLLNITHKPTKADPSKVYEQISGITPLMKNQVCPPQVNKMFVLSYDDFDEAKFETLPDFIKDKMKTSTEYASINAKTKVGDLPWEQPTNGSQDEDDLPF